MLFPKFDQMKNRRDSNQHCEWIIIIHQVERILQQTRPININLQKFGI